MDPEIVVVGTGPGPVGLLTREAEEALLASPKIFFRFSANPVYHWLKEQGKDLFCFDFAYTIPRIGWADIYQLIAQAILKEATLRGRAVYALPGNPLVFEQSARLIHGGAREHGISFRVIPGMSFLELIYTELAIDPVLGLQIASPGDLHRSPSDYSAHIGLIIGLVGMGATPDPDCDETNIETMSDWLLARYPPDHQVSLVWTEGMPDYETQSRALLLQDFVQYFSQATYLTSLYVPPIQH